MTSRIGNIPCDPEVRSMLLGLALLVAVLPLGRLCVLLRERRVTIDGLVAALQESRCFAAMVGPVWPDCPGLNVPKSSYPVRPDSDYHI